MLVGRLLMIVPMLAGVAMAVGVIGASEGLRRRAGTANLRPREAAALLSPTSIVEAPVHATNSPPLDPRQPLPADPMPSAQVTEIVHEPDGGGVRKVIAPHATAASTRTALSPAEPPSDPLDDLSEVTLLRRARAAVGSNPSLALEYVTAHARRFPQGALGQEREVIGIDALTRLERTAEARAKASAFLARYPQSAYRLRVQSALIPGSAESNP
jgi:hypothetical protein